MEGGCEGPGRIWSFRASSGEVKISEQPQFVAQPSTSRNWPRQTKTGRKMAVLSLRDATGDFQAPAVSSGLLKGRLTALLRNDSLTPSWGTLFHGQCESARLRFSILWLQVIFNARSKPAGFDTSCLSQNSKYFVAIPSQLSSII
jgi:hypothetical protein